MRRRVRREYTILTVDVTDDVLEMFRFATLCGFYMSNIHRLFGVSLHIYDGHIAIVSK